MSWKNFKYIYLGLFMIFLISSVVAFYWAVDFKPQNKPKIPAVQEPKEKIFRVSEETKIFFTEKYIICNRYDLNCIEKEHELTGKERAELNDLSYEELVEKFKEKDETIERNNNKITIIHWLDGLCPEHLNSWHLGLDSSGEYVTVFYGPSEVKADGGIYKVTEIPIKNLSPDYQQKVRNYSLEFYQKEEMIATLDSLSEFLD